ncbi:MAG: hypothetical protein K8I03_12720 [Ignavibacteria bacterium]|nr:hypothetical protein [Ignavibacteria bacterium]
MKFTKYIIPVLMFMFVFCNTIKADDLNTKKMEQITSEILNVFVGDAPDKSKLLRKYISEEWLDKKNLKISKYSINNYSPTTFEIIYSGADICVATISGESWSHLLVFKFTEEYGKYYVVPRGISEASSDYIDPWWKVNDYICNDTKSEDKDK